MDPVNLIILVAAGIYGVVKYFADRAQQQKAGEAPPPAPPAPGDAWEEQDEVDAWFEPDAAEPARPVAVAAPAAADTSERQALRLHLDELIERAEQDARVAMVERHTTRLATVLDAYVVPRARALRDRSSRPDERIGPAHYRELQHLSVVEHAAASFIDQRRTPGLREALGEADTMARSFYQPLIDFAHMSRIELSTTKPVVVLAPYDGRVWDSFVATDVAPLFLPRDVFRDVRRWPAIAHEIAHDFLAACRDVEAQIRHELELPDEHEGSYPLQLSGRGVSLGDVYRVMGAFFEEIFCDVFGILMLGPAYAYTFIDVFAQPYAPDRTIMVATGNHGRYDRHPPALMRVMVCARALRLLGEDRVADEIMAEWNEVHGERSAFLFPTVEGHTLSIPARAIEPLIDEIVTRLHSGRFAALGGGSLTDIPGLQYGPHRANEARRAMGELLSGRAPTQRNACIVVAAAVLAWREDRARHDAILALARRALAGEPARQPDAYTAHAPAPRAERAPGASLGPREAFLLHTMLAPPRSVRHAPGRWPRRAGGFLARPRWP